MRHRFTFHRTTGKKRKMIVAAVYQFLEIEEGDENGENELKS